MLPTHHLTLGHELKDTDPDSQCEFPVAIGPQLTMLKWHHFDSLSFQRRKTDTVLLQPLP
jgi:hypothetical protein